MKPFNLEEAKAGKPVCTRDGRDVRILSFDLDSPSPIVGVFWNKAHSSENAYQFYPNGAFTCCGDTVTDLFMKDEKPTLDDYTTIKTYEDACKALGLNKGVTDTISYMSGLSTVPKHIIALMKLETISCALWGREWQPKPDAKRHKQYFLPQFAFYSQEEIIDEEKGDSFLPIHSNNEPNTFLGLMYTHYVISNSVAHNNFRLCQETTEKARYFGKQFIELWAEYLGFNF